MIILLFYSLQCAVTFWVWKKGNITEKEVMNNIKFWDIFILLLLVTFFKSNFTLFSIV